MAREPSLTKIGLKKHLSSTESGSTKGEKGGEAVGLARFLEIHRVNAKPVGKTI